jgi:hypothetical protein
LKSKSIQVERISAKTPTLHSHWPVRISFASLSFSQHHVTHHHVGILEGSPLGHIRPSRRTRHTTIVQHAKMAGHSTAPKPHPAPPQV